MELFGPYEHRISGCVLHFLLVALITVYLMDIRFGGVPRSRAAIVHFGPILCLPDVFYIYGLVAFVFGGVV